MHTKCRWPTFGSAALLLFLGLASASGAVADDGDPPSRVARLAFVDGVVSLQPGGTEEWVEAALNRPLTTGDALWADVNSRAELQLDGSMLRLGSHTSISFLNLADQITQIQLTSGTLIVRVRQLDPDESYEIDTPNLAFSVLQPGLYRISVNDSGNMTSIAVRRGQGEVTDGGAVYTVNADQQIDFAGTDNLTAAAEPSPQPQTPFDVWSASRDDRWDHSISAQYVSPDVVGYADLDDQGSWNSTPDYGYVWFPRGVRAGWAPYQSGHWAYIAPWGYTWIDDQPWGFAPFHYGRWVSMRGAWGWVPSPRPSPGQTYVRPGYAPALVAWIGVDGGVAWFALGPRDVYVPSYPASRNYFTNINVSNTIVNRTVVNNFYNTTVVNKHANVTNVIYANRQIAGAVTATTAQAFNSGRPVASYGLHVDARGGAQTQVRVFAPAAVPTRQAVMGGGRVATARPPAALQTRTVVARTTPPPPRPTFERRQQAIQANGGRPLSMAALRQIQTQAASRAAPFRIAPPPTPGSARPSFAAPQQLGRGQDEQARRQQNQAMAQQQAQQREQLPAQRQQAAQQEQERQRAQLQDEQARRQQLQQQAARQEAERPRPQQPPQAEAPKPPQPHEQPAPQKSQTKPADPRKHDPARPDQ